MSKFLKSVLILLLIFIPIIAYRNGKSEGKNVSIEIINDNVNKMGFGSLLQNNISNMGSSSNSGSVI